MLSEQDRNHYFDGDQFISLPVKERVEHCRREARKARALAGHADPQHAGVYQDIARQWPGLADDMERASGASCSLEGANG